MFSEKERTTYIGGMMFEWMNQPDVSLFRQKLRENPWMRKVLINYCFDSNYIFFNQRRVEKVIGLKKGESFKRKFLLHLKTRRRELVETPMNLQSFEYLHYIIQKLKKNTINHYDVTLPYFLQLSEDDVSSVLDILMKKFKLSNEQVEILKGGL